MLVGEAINVLLGFENLTRKEQLFDLIFAYFLYVVSLYLSSLYKLASEICKHLNSIEISSDRKLL
jgi:hypothetical protein